MVADKEKINTDNDDEEILQIYEIGYHVIPTLSEADLANIVSDITKLLKKAGGSIVSEEFPKMRALSYSIHKVISGAKHKFNSSYFGWVKFEVDSKNIDQIKKNLDKIEQIFRSIIIKTVKESTMSSIKMMPAKVQIKEITRKTKVSEYKKTPISEAEIDKQIDLLVSE